MVAMVRSGRWRQLEFVSLKLRLNPRINTNFQTISCKGCGKGVRKWFTKNSTPFCSGFCHGRYVANNKIAQEAHRRTCRVCKKPFHGFTDFKSYCSAECQNERAKQRKRTRERKREKREFKLQKKNHKPSERPQTFYYTDAWRKLRYSIIRKYGKQCMACGLKITGFKLHVDHIKPRSKFPELELDPNNLQILCDDCNMGKGAWDQTDWRPVPSQPSDILS